MFIIEYMQDNRLNRINNLNSFEAKAVEDYLVGLASITLVIVWGPL